MTTEPTDDQQRPPRPRWWDRLIYYSVEYGLLRLLPTAAAGALLGWAWWAWWRR